MRASFIALTARLRPSLRIVRIGSVACALGCLDTSAPLRTGIDLSHGCPTVPFPLAWVVGDHSTGLDWGALQIDATGARPNFDVSPPYACILHIAAHSLPITDSATGGGEMSAALWIDVMRGAWQLGLARSNTDSLIVTLPSAVTGWTTESVRLMSAGSVRAQGHVSVIPVVATDRRRSKYLNWGLGKRGALSLRVDDIFASDTTLFRLLRERQLTAEVAVPSAWVGLPGHVDRQMLQIVRDAGFSISAHSRLHGKDPTSAAAFVIETLGAKDELRAMGFSPWSFAQPGTWTDAFDFSDSLRLRSPGADFIRTYFTVLEAYPPHSVEYTPPLSGSELLAVNHATLDLTSVDFAIQWVDRVVRDRKWMEWMIHSYQIGRPGHESWQDVTRVLDHIVALRDSGQLLVVSPLAIASASSPGEPSNFLDFVQDQPLAPQAMPMTIQARQCVSSHLALGAFSGQGFELRVELDSVPGTGAAVATVLRAKSGEVLNSAANVRQPDRLIVPFGVAGAGDIRLQLCNSGSGQALHVVRVAVTQL
jgi:hypothetical protein